MAKLNIFFEGNPIDLPAAAYIKTREPWQRAQLEEFVTELEKTGGIQHTDARLLTNGKWSLWVRADGRDAVNHVCYVDDRPLNELSHLARQILNPSAGSNISPRQNRRELIIVSSSARSGEEPESRSPESYCLGLDEVGAKIFREVIAALVHGAPSPHYSLQENGDYSIHIDRPDLAYGVHIYCTARWID